MAIIPQRPVVSSLKKLKEEIMALVLNKVSMTD